MTDVQEFRQSFRGYDVQQVDAEVQRLREAVEQSRRSAQAAAQDVTAQAEHHRDDMAAAEQRITSLETQLIELQSRLQAAESRSEILSREVNEEDDGDGRRFEEILRVAEEQATSLIDNAVTQADRIVADARSQIEKDRAAVKDETDRMLAQAKHEESQSRIRIDTDRTAHKAELESREAKHQERVAQAESEANVLLSEADRAASALRAQTTGEADAMRTEAERILREAKARELELDAAAKRRQDEAQQEFLRLHNHAIQHAERITGDANDKVASALQHANHIAEQAQAFEDLSRAQALHTERQAVAKATAILGEARSRAHSIVDAVLGHSKDVLHEAEDRSRTLRFQQQQLQGFRAELGQLMQVAEATRAALPTFGDDAAQPADAERRDGASQTAASRDAPSQGGPAAAPRAPEASEAFAAASTSSDLDVSVAEDGPDAADPSSEPDVVQDTHSQQIHVEDPFADELTIVTEAPLDDDEVVEATPADERDDERDEAAHAEQVDAEQVDAPARVDGGGIVSEQVEVVWHEDRDER